MAGSHLSRILALAVALALPGGPALAEPTCPVTETCRITRDNCTPADGMLLLRVLPTGKAEIRLNDNPPLQSTILDMNATTIMLFSNGGEEHQLRLGVDGTFSYLISVPDRDAPKGKLQTLYRGQCVEG